MTDIRIVGGLEGRDSKRSTLKTLTLGVATFALLPIHGAALAQTSSSSPETAAEDEVIVTGSRIRRDAVESTVPLLTIDFQQFDEIGTTDLAEALTELPGVEEGVAQRNSNNFIQTSGLSTISLRRLGDDRTLALINGKRAVSNSGNADRVSVSTIPAGLVEATDITTGGLSAIYGSDAIAGVVNFRLEDDFTGFEADARYSTPEASGGEEFRLNATYGVETEDGRGYFLLGGTYRDDNMIMADSTRPESILAVEFDDPSFSSNDAFANEPNQPGCRPEPANNDFHCFLGSFSGFTPGGVFEGGDAWNVGGVWFNDQSLQPSDRTGSADFFGDADGYNFRPDRTLSGEREIINIGATGRYDFTPDLTGSLTALFSSVESNTLGGFQNVSGTTRYGLLDANSVGNISSSHPFIPPEVEETRSGSVSFARRFVEVGQNQRINDRDTIRLMGDLTGTLNENFDFELYGTYGYFKQEQQNPNEINLARLSAALDVETVGGVVQCSDADRRAEGCVPINIFGEGSITTQAADYIRYNGFGEQSRTQYSAGGYITGDLIDIGSRTIQAVFGAEFRREEQNTDGDPDGDLIGGLDGDPTTDDVFQTTLATFPSVESSYDVVEAFGELKLPVTDTFTAEVAGRIADYTTVGTVYSWNVASTWRPTPNLNFRANFARAQRAPSLTEFFSPARTDSDGLDDPCSGLLADGTGITGIAGDGAANADLAVVTRNCLSEPGIQAYFANPENDPDFDPPGSVNGPNSGNPNVREETADTITLGFGYRPEWFDGLTLVVDYFRINIEDAITSISTQNTVSLCYSAQDFPNNRFCDVITRNPETGFVTEVINFQENLNEENVEGIDVTVNYEFELPSVPGDFDLRLNYSHYIEDEVLFEGIGGEEIRTSSLGEIGSADDEFRATMSYDLDNFRLRYTLLFEEGGVDDPVNDPDPTFERFFRTGDEFFHRIYARYDFGPDNQYRIYGGVNNIFDNLGPVLPSGLDNGDTRNIVSDLNDLTGREFYAGVRVRF